MCGELRYSFWSKLSKQPVRPGCDLPGGSRLYLSPPPPGDKKVDLPKSPLRWQGFARQEVEEKWRKGGWIPGTLRVDSFTEQGKEFKVPEGKGIRILYLPRGNCFNIVTREARTADEKEIHPRWPVFEKLPEEE